MNNNDMTNSTTTTIQKFVFQKFPLARRRNLGLNDSLLESGVVDSLGVLEIVAFLDEQFAIKVNDDELIPENFQDITAIASFVDRALQLEAR